jgi:hypothetical protein
MLSIRRFRVNAGSNATARCCSDTHLSESIDGRMRTLWESGAGCLGDNRCRYVGSRRAQRERDQQGGNGRDRNRAPQSPLGGNSRAGSNPAPGIDA